MNAIYLLAGTLLGSGVANLTSGQHDAWVWAIIAGTVLVIVGLCMEKAR